MFKRVNSLIRYRDLPNRFVLGEKLCLSWDQPSLDVMILKNGRMKHKTSPGARNSLAIPSALLNWRILTKPSPKQ
jgi:hypothetical protein